MKVFWFEICFYASYEWSMYWYTQSLKSEWCPCFSRCSSFWTLSWCSCSCIRGTRCLPCHFGTTWNWCAWARWCTVPKRGKRLTCFWLAHIQWSVHDTHHSVTEGLYLASLKNEYTRHYIKYYRFYKGQWFY